MIIETNYHSNYHPFWCWIWFILVSEGPFERNISSVIRDKSIAVWKVFCQSVVTSILRNRNFWDSLRFPLVFLTTKACKAPINGTHTSKGHLLKISLNHTLDSALLVEGFAKIVPVFNVPALFVKKAWHIRKYDDPAIAYVVNGAIYTKENFSTEYWSIRKKDTEIFRHQGLHLCSLD